jgi:hypothetical protein
MSSTTMTSWIRMRKALPVPNRTAKWVIPSEGVMTSLLISHQEWEGWAEEGSASEVG